MANEKNLFLTEKELTGIEIASTLGDNLLGSCVATLTKKAQGKGYLEGEENLIVWASGHLYEDLKIQEISPSYKFYQRFEDVEGYKMPLLLSQMKKIPTPTKRAAFHRNIIKKMLSRNNIKALFVAVDADAEGETIFRDIVFNAGVTINYPIYRLWITGAFSSKVSIMKALDRKLPYNDAKYENLYASQRARGNSDFLLGMKLTKSCVEAYNKEFYVGRVMAVIINLIGSRELEIKNFVPEDFWKLNASLNKITLKHFFMKEEEDVDKEGKAITKNVRHYNYFNSEEIKKVESDVYNSGLYANVEICSTKVTSSEKRPLPLSGSDFVAIMGEKYNVASKTAEEILSFLRSQGFTTYQGTNGRYFLPDDAVDVQVSLNTLNAYFGFEAAFTTDSYVFNKKKAEKQNHPPLSVTEKVPTAADIQQWGKEKLPFLKEAYELIAKRVLLPFLEDDKIEKQSLVVITKDGHRFSCNGEKAIKQGWRTFIGLEKEDTTFSMDGITVGSQIKFNEINIDEGKTTKPPLHTEGSILSTLGNVSGVVDKKIKEEVNPAKIAELKKMKILMKEAEGIGTERTRVPTLTKLKDEYKTIKMTSKKIITLTPHGWELFHILPPLVKNVILTARWENSFEQIRNGEILYSEFIQKVDTLIMDKMIPSIWAERGKIVKIAEEPKKAEKIPFPDAKCPLCASDMMQTDKVFVCKNRDKTAAKPCKFFLVKEMYKTFGRKIEGLADYNRLLSSTEHAPMKETMHGVYFNPKEKFFVSVIWGEGNQAQSIADGKNKEGLEQTQPRTLITTKGTYRYGNSFIFKKFRGSNIREEDAEKILRGETVTVTRKSKEGKKYKIEITKGKDGNLNTSFPKR